MVQHTDDESVVRHDDDDGSEDLHDADNGSVVLHNEREELEGMA